MADKNFDANEWLGMLEQTEGSLQALTVEIRDLDKRGGSVAARRNVAKKMQQANDDISTLARVLAKMEAAPMKYSIGEGEVHRRQGLLTNLRGLAQGVEELAGNSKNSRLNLMNSKKRGGGGEPAQETEHTEHLSNSELLQDTKETIAQQDQKLDRILDGVTKIKSMSYDINSELDLQQHLLQDLDESVENTDKRILQSTAGVDHIQEQEGGCCALIVMVLLLVFIVVLASSNWACHIFKPSAC